MSEHIQSNGEYKLGHENEQTRSKESEILKQKLETGRQTLESTPTIEAVRASVHEHATLTRDRNTLDEDKNVSTTGDNIRWWSSELRAQALDRTLSSVRNRLNGSDKQLSKFIHQPVVEKVSDIAGKTVVRPSGILFGGLFSFLGSIGAYLLAKHLGGELHYSIFAVCFIGGFVIGLFVELLWRVVHLKRAK